jgi:hypothetical protein
MKKATKAAPKKAAAKKPAAKKSSAKPKRKAAWQSDLAQLIERLAVIANKLTETAERLSEAAGHADLSDALENLDAIADKLADKGNQLAGTGMSEQETAPQDEARGAGEEEMIVIVDQHKEE